MPSRDLSIVIPLLNEAESLRELCQWIKSVCTPLLLNYEIILIDDGSTDDSWAVIEQLASQEPTVKGIRFMRNYGKSAALQVGFEAANGRVVITMDADLQDSPDEIPALYQKIVQEGYHLVSGWKAKRYDPISKTLPTKLFNAVTRKVSGLPLHDFNCGLKAYDYRVVKNIEVYGEMHRYIPVIAKWSGFKKITEQVVQHRPRKYGVSKFGLNRFLNGFLDLLSITFIMKFKKKPMHFFGGLGILSFLLGSLVTLWIILEKQYLLYQGLKVRNITDQPLFFLALVALIIGVQFFTAGYLGEMIHAASDKKGAEYIIDQRINFTEEKEPK